MVYWTSSSIFKVKNENFNFYAGKSIVLEICRKKITSKYQQDKE